MIPTKIRLFVLCAALAACADKAPKTAQVSEALPNLPLPPDAKFVDRSAGPDALQVTLHSSASADYVTAYYRGVFQKGGWHLVNEAKDAEGVTVLFAQRDGPPLWVRIQSDAGGTGSVVQLSGAVTPKGVTPKPRGKTDSPAAKPTS